MLSCQGSRDRAERDRAEDGQISGLACSVDARTAPRELFFAMAAEATATQRAEAASGIKREIEALLALPAAAAAAFGPSKAAVWRQLSRRVSTGSTQL